jgi:hypothetical protein
MRPTNRFVLKLGVPRTLLVITVTATVCAAEPITHRNPADNQSIEPITTINELLTSGYLSDFTIVAGVDSEAQGPLLRIAVHKLVLSPRSPVLKSTLESGMAERVSGQLRITYADAAWGWSLLVFSTRGPAQSKGPTLRRCWLCRAATRCPNRSASVSAAYLMTSPL